MTPMMAERVAFLRQKAAEGYSMRWACGELGINLQTLRVVCWENGIRMKSTSSLSHGLRLAKSRGMTLQKTETIRDCEDFLPDVGECE